MIKGNVSIFTPKCPLTLSGSVSDGVHPVLTVMEQKLVGRPSFVAGQQRQEIFAVYKVIGWQLHVHSSRDGG